MKERRKAPRVKTSDEITISVTPEDKNISKKKFLYNYSKDISVSGTRIESSILLPVDTVVKIAFKLKNLKKEITALGKVKWIKVLIEDKSYEAGVEFVDIPSEAVKRLEYYIGEIIRRKIIDKNFNGS
ncbi:hypothetical protein ASZ90_006141 [hydrocarbon metagenome]|uniref:PilZ domain-containing protein n=1 Tax=hydrocarbon metagenome TaxID=938273 RepID=A0A0W8FT49_9ZZZZ